MSLPPRVGGAHPPAAGPLVDAYARIHDYLRVSVTDRCNYRCTYCMPATGFRPMPRAELLSLEEIARIVRVAATLGVRRVRLTGGEPTVRNNLVQLVRWIRDIPDITDLSLTTNGHAFAAMARPLADAGLSRVNISIDSLDPDSFRAITRGGDLARVLAAVDAARAAGLTPIKINCVLVAGVNDDQVFPMLERFAPHAGDTVVRFIEYMPFDKESGRHHLPVAAVRAQVAERWGLSPVDEVWGGGPARMWRVHATDQRVGFISAITEHFCERCNRLRLSADGHLRTCLSRDAAPSLRTLVRAGADDAALATALRSQVWGKVAGHEAHLDQGWQRFEGVMTRIGG